MLGHLYPKGENVLVATDVSLVLETLQPQCTSVGEWVNVIGYVTQRKGDVIGASVQAVMVWPTGAFDVQSYEKAVEDGLL